MSPYPFSSSFILPVNIEYPLLPGMVAVSGDILVQKCNEVSSFRELTLQLRVVGR